MTHDQLITSAVGWLKNKKGCSIVASELVTSGLEKPDAIGWNGWASILVEAKISMSDFRADQKKLFRKYSETGMGVYRYYIVPLELKDDVLSLLPEGWGLLSCKGRSVRVEVASNMFKNNTNNEILFLSSVIRRIAASNEIKGIAVRVYTVDISNPKAELFIVPSTD